MSTVRIVALGQIAAADDGVGFAVLEAIDPRALPPEARCFAARDATDLIAHLSACDALLLIDAVRAPDPPGTILELELADLAASGRAPLSSHVLSVPDAVSLAAIVHPDRPPPPVWIVGVAIASVGFGPELSPAVAAAVPGAAGRVVARAWSLVLP